MCVEVCSTKYNIAEKSVTSQNMVYLECVLIYFLKIDICRNPHSHKVYLQCTLEVSTKLFIFQKEDTYTSQEYYRSQIFVLVYTTKLDVMKSGYTEMLIGVHPVSLMLLKSERTHLFFPISVSNRCN